MRSNGRIRADACSTAVFRVIHLVLPPNETVRFGLKSKILSYSGTRSPSPPYRNRARTNKRR